MIGNDIIDRDLLRQHPRSSHPRFRNKILSDREQAWLCHSTQPDIDIWVLWSLKESAYKCYFQQHLRRVFAPKKFSCQWISMPSADSIRQARISTPAGDLFATVEQSEKYIHALCSDKEAEWEGKNFQIVPLSSQHPAEESKLLRSLAREWIAGQLTIGWEELQWECRQGIPLLSYGRQLLPVSISLSHHGKWGAVALAH